MAFLTILRTSEDTCEQCGATEHALQFVISQDDEDSIRLTACVICVVVAMDNAMEWHMSRQFAQALANRAAGEQVQAETKRQKEAYDERVREAESRTRARVSSPSGTGRSAAVLSLGFDDPDDGGKPSETTKSRRRDSRKENSRKKH